MTDTRAAHSPEGRWELIGPADCPIMWRRTLYSSRWLKVLWHRFMPNASDESAHDHPRPFVTIVLRGGYDDVSPCMGCRSSETPGWILGDPSDDWRQAQPMSVCQGCSARAKVIDRVYAPAIRYRPAEHSHITRVGPKGATTLCIMGPLQREWGFWRDGKWYPWRTFERIFGLNWRCP